MEFEAPATVDDGDGFMYGHVAVGIDKAGIKAKIKALKSDRGKAIEAQDPKELTKVRRKIHKLKRELRAHAT